MAELPPREKISAAFYRVGVLSIRKGHHWCVYHGEKLLGDARFKRLRDATWWAQHNQPKESK